MRYSILLICLLTALPVRAEVTINGEKMGGDICRTYTQYLEPPGVAYVPGTDVNGNQVTPADIYPAPPLPVADPIIIPLTIDLAQRYDLDTDGVDLDYMQGVLEVFKDGRVYYNGQQVGEENLTACE